MASVSMFWVDFVVTVKMDMLENAVKMVSILTTRSFSLPPLEFLTSTLPYEYKLLT